MGGEIHTTFGNAFSLGDFTVAANTHVSGEYTLATSYDGTTSNLYVNGDLITQTTPTITAGVKDFILGKEFDGYVKNFKFWNYAKSNFTPPLPTYDVSFSVDDLTLTVNVINIINAHSKFTITLERTDGSILQSHQLVGGETSFSLTQTETSYTTFNYVIKINGTQTDVYQATYVAPVLDGSTVARAALSASSILTLNPSATSGNYWIKPENYTGPAVLLWCEMSNLSGGWTLIGKGRQHNGNSGGWFGTESEINTSGLQQANAFSAGVSKVSSTFVNYLMNGTANGWDNSNNNNYLVVNRISNASDGYSGIGDSFYFKVTNESTFKWIAQFGRADDNQTTYTGSGVNRRYNSTWLTGGQYGSTSSTFSDNYYGGNNSTNRLFTWHWTGHNVYHGWSSGQSENRGFVYSNEGHAIQFVQLWAR